MFLWCGALACVHSLLCAQVRHKCTCNSSCTATTSPMADQNNNHTNNQNTPEVAQRVAQRR